MVIGLRWKPRGRGRRFLSARRQELPFARRKTAAVIASRGYGLYEWLAFSAGPAEVNLLSRNRSKHLINDRNHA
jgi:hypothetical protein